MVGIYKLLTDTGILELGTRPSSINSGNLCFKFLVQYFCSKY
jgi:hypothetical protein